MNMDPDRFMYTGDVTISRLTHTSYWCYHKVWVDDIYYGWWKDADIYHLLISRGLEIPDHLLVWKENQIMEDLRDISHLVI
jgi:hypothetical protein